MDLRSCLKPSLREGYSQEQLDQIARERGLDPTQYRTKSLLCAGLVNLLEPERKENDQPLSGDLEVSQIEEPLSPEEVLELLDQAPKVSKFPTQPSVIHDLIFSFLPFDTPPLCRKLSSEYMKKTCTPPRQPHGILETYYPDPRRRQLESQVPYWDGKLHRVARYWDENGKLIERTEYQEGMKDGKSETWARGGFTESFFQRGHLHGVSTFINPIMMRKETLFQEGTRIESREFCDEGYVIAMSSYNPQGITTKYFNSKGNISSVVEDYGPRVTETFYDSHGGITRRITNNEDTEIAQVERFYPSGQIRSRITTRFGGEVIQVEKWGKNGDKL